MRFLLRLADPPLEIALLRAGHQVRTMPPADGALAGLAAWPARRAVAAFEPERIVAAPGDAEAARMAARLGAPLLAPPDDTPFLADPFLPPPFRATGWPPVVALSQHGKAASPFAPLPADGRFLIPPDIVVLGPLPAAALPHWMAAGCAIVAPDSKAVRRYLTPMIAVLHPTGADPVPLALDLVRDTEARRRLAEAARAAFETRHDAALAAILALAD